MIYRSYLTSYPFRHAISAGLSVFIAILAEYYFSFSKSGWIILTAFLISHTTRGTPLKQNINLALIILAAVFFSSMLANNIPQINILYGIISAIFIFTGYMAFVNRPLQNKTYFFTILFTLVLLVSVFSPTQPFLVMADQFIDIMMGAIIGILCSQLFLPVRLDKEFRSAMIPLLQILADYSDAIVGYFRQQNNLILKEKNENHFFMEKKSQIEKLVQEQQNTYPEWVFEVGFNRGLRSGFRFFLVNVERITEIFSSMDYFLLYSSGTFAFYDLEMLKLHPFLANAMQKNKELLTILIEYFKSEALLEPTADFTSDIVELENAAQRFVPGSLELLDISPDFITITAFVRDIKDLRELLLQLVMSLPRAEKSAS